MKRSWWKRAVILALALCAALLPLTASAQTESGSYIDNPALEEWEGDIPTQWDLQTDCGWMARDVLSDGTSCAVLCLDEDGYAFLTQDIYLQPQSVYVISALVYTEGIAGDYPAANINIDGQPYAEAGFISNTGGAWETIRLCIKTNIDDEQTYTLRIGMGKEDMPTTGQLYIDDILIEKRAEEPEDLTVFPVLGSLGGGMEIDEYEVDSQPAQQPEYWHSASDITYNDVGLMLFVCLLFLALYLALRGKWRERLAHFLENRRVVVLLFLIAFILRFIIAALERGHITDLDCFRGWSAQLAETGLGGFYESGIFVDYPPAYMYILWIIGHIGKLFGLSASGGVYGVLVRMPAIFCDLALAYVVYRIGRRHGSATVSMAAAMFILFNPALIATSSGWGQIDSVFILCSLLALDLLYRDKKVFAAMLWMLSFLIKPQALLLLPIFAIVYLGDLFTRGRSLRTLGEFALSLIGAAAVYVIVALPMMGGQDILYVLRLTLNTTSYYNYGAVGAFNLMALLGGYFAPDSQTVLLTSYRSLGIALIILLILGAAVFYLRKKDKKEIFLTAAVFLIGVFMLAHQMHERYILPGLVFLFIAAMLADSRRLFQLGIAFSLLSYLNIVIVLLFGADWMNEIITIVFSAANLIAFILLIWVLIRESVLGRPHAQLLQVGTLQMPPWKVRQKNAAARRLEAPLLSKERKMKGKDWLVCAVITVVYAAVAFLNLGSMVIPRETEPVGSDGAQIQIELEQPALASQLKYYAGYCEGDFTIYTSADGADYREWEAGIHEHKYSHMFHWQFLDLEEYVRYVRIELTDGQMEFREIALTGEDGELLPIASAQLVGETGTTAAPWLVDEQDQVPRAMTYMTDMYFDEVYHARTAYEYMHRLFPYEITHPPLGKSIITIGIRLFGFTPFGWRFMGTLFGVLQLPLFFILAKRIFKKTKWAAIATVLFASDFMHYALTRIATIDSYSIFFILLMYLFMYEYTQHNFHREKLSRTLLPLGLCGIAFGLGAATKWLCIYAGLGLAVIFFYTVYQRHQEYKLAKEQGKDEVTAKYRKKLILTLLFCVLVFIIIPVVIYCVSYIPYFGCVDRNFKLVDIWHNQEYMLNYHGNLAPAEPHPYSSSIYTWPFTIRPVFFFRAGGQLDGQSGLIWCMGNPFVWWGALAAILYILGHRKGERGEWAGLPFLAVAALSQFLPWLLISREVFIYHYFATLPFIILVTVYALRQIDSRGKAGKRTVWIYVVLCILLFVAFYPAITGILVPRLYNQMIQWLPTWPV